MIQFDEHIVQMGWNHQLGIFVLPHYRAVFSIQTTGVSRPWVELKNTKVPVLGVALRSKLNMVMLKFEWNGMKWNEMKEWVNKRMMTMMMLLFFRYETIPWYILFIALQIFDCINEVFWKIQLDSWCRIWFWNINMLWSPKRYGDQICWNMITQIDSNFCIFASISIT